MKKTGVKKKAKGKKKARPRHGNLISPSFVTTLYGGANWILSKMSSSSSSSSSNKTNDSSSSSSSRRRLQKQTYSSVSLFKTKPFQIPS